MKKTTQKQYERKLKDMVITSYDEVWRTKGEMRKALGEVDEFVDAISE